MQTVARWQGILVVRLSDEVSFKMRLNMAMVLRDLRDEGKSFYPDGAV